MNRLLYTYMSYGTMTFTLIQAIWLESLCSIIDLSSYPHYAAKCTDNRGDKGSQETVMQIIWMGESVELTSLAELCRITSAYCVCKEERF